MGQHAGNFQIHHDLLLCPGHRPAHFSDDILTCFYIEFTRGCLRQHHLPDFGRDTAVLQQQRITIGGGNERHHQRTRFCGIFFIKDHAGRNGAGLWNHKINIAAFAQSRKPVRPVAAAANRRNLPVPGILQQAIRHGVDNPAFNPEKHQQRGQNGCQTHYRTGGKQSLIEVVSQCQTKNRLKSAHIYLCSSPLL